jgi:hypothetical protein
MRSRQVKSGDTIRVAKAAVPYSGAADGSINVWTMEGIALFRFIPTGRYLKQTVWYVVNRKMFIDTGFSYKLLKLFR